MHAAPAFVPGSQLFCTLPLKNYLNNNSKSFGFSEEIREYFGRR